MKYLVDANVLLPLAIKEHSAKEAALRWWSGLEPKSVVLCLPVRLAVLRLVSNSTIMGVAVEHPEQAWSTWQAIVSDERTVVVEDSPAGLDGFWHANIRGRKATPQLWTDAWLAAFAEAMGLEMVTFDRGFRSFRSLKLTLLKA